MKNMITPDIRNISTHDGTENQEKIKHFDSDGNLNEKLLAFAEGFIEAYDNTEDDKLNEKRNENRESDIRTVIAIVNKNGMIARSNYWEIEGKHTLRIGETNEEGMYKKENVSAMARLLKIAKELNEDNERNPDGENVLARFISVPQIDYYLRQMGNEMMHNEKSYMYDLKMKSRKIKEAKEIKSKGETKEKVLNISEDDYKDIYNLTDINKIDTILAKLQEQKTKLQKENSTDKDSQGTNR